MKKWISLFLAVAMLFALSLPVFAAKSEAQTLHELGLFKGTGTDAAGKPVFDLNRAPTRAEAVTMLVRLLGKEDEALAGDWNTPFIDVADWAKPYVGYAYANGLTAGVSQTRFGSESSVTAAQFLTFVLRALGYHHRSRRFRGIYHQHKVKSPRRRQKSCGGVFCRAWGRTPFLICWARRQGKKAEFD